MDPRWRLVGRGAELARARQELSSADRAGLVLAGAAGVGKSRLAAEVVAEVAGSGQRVVRCAATKATASIPFAAVAALVPEVDVTVKDRFGVFRAVARSLGGPAGCSDGVVVSVDDAHLLDEASAALIHHLVMQSLVRVVVTVRTGEDGPDAVTALWKDGHCLRLDLEDLSRTEHDELTSAIIGGSVERQTLNRLWGLSCGNPMLLRELVQHAAAIGTLTEHRGYWRWRGETEPGDRLVDVVGLRLGQLRHADRTAIALLAFGEPLGLVELEEMVGDWSSESVVGAGLVRAELDGGQHVLTLGHPLYGEIIRTRTSKVRATELLGRLVHNLQGRLATRLGEPARSGEAGRLARWALDAGMPLDSDTLLRAAREASRASDFALAERLARADPDWAIHETGYILGAALAAQELDEEAEEVLAKAAIAPPDQETGARVAYERMELLFHPLHRPEEAAAVFAEAMATISDPEWRDLLTAGWAPSLVASGRIAEAMELLEPMVASSEARTRLAALRGLAYVLVPAGQTSRVLDLCDELLGPALERDGEWEHGLFDVFAARITALLMEGRLDEGSLVLQVGESAIDLAREATTFSFINVGLGRVALFRGQPATAERKLREALAGFSRLDLGARGSWTFRLLAEALALQGDIDGARAALQDAQLSDGPLQDPFVRDGERATAWVWVAAGELDRARAALRAAASVSAEAGQHGYEALVLHDLIRLGADPAAAGRLLDLAADVEGPGVVAYADHARALSTDDGPLLDEVSTRFEELGFLLLAAEAATEAASAHHCSALAGRASRSMARAHRLREDCEAAVTPALLGGPALVSLTRREREVATLAARGMASKEIASALALSSRTVDNHLQRSYSKLGVVGRSQLAGALGLGSE